MSKPQVILTNDVRHELEKLSTHEYIQIKQALDNLGTTNLFSPKVRVTGPDGTQMWMMRISDKYRAIFKYESEDRILVLRLYKKGFGDGFSSGFG